MEDFALDWICLNSGLRRDYFSSLTRAKRNEAAGRVCATCAMARPDD